jgi:hypothetical protein
VAYGAAKAGVQLLTQDLVAQVGPHGIRANCIAPETILTEKNKAWIPEQQQQQLIQSHPLRRLGTPQDVAQAAVYLASDEASWITGVVLDISGGAVRCDALTAKHRRANEPWGKPSKIVIGFPRPQDVASAAPGGCHGTSRLSTTYR